MERLPTILARKSKVCLLTILGMAPRLFCSIQKVRALLLSDMWCRIRGVVQGNMLVKETLQQSNSGELRGFPFKEARELGIDGGKILFETFDGFYYRL